MVTTNDAVLLPSDFAVFAPHRQRDKLLNPARRKTRAKLGAIGKRSQAHLKSAHGLALQIRTSISHPYSFNAYKVDALWFYLSREKKDREGLHAVLGEEFSEDLDPNYLHLLFFGEIHEKGFRTGLRCHERAWWDTQNISSILKDAAGRKELSALLQPLADFLLRIHDYQKLYRAEEMTPGLLQTFGDYFKPGEHRFTLWTEYCADDPRLLSADWPQVLADRLSLLVSVYRKLAWSPQNDRVFHEARARGADRSAEGRAPSPRTTS